MSVHVQKLETELGHALFERRGRTIVLTEAGRITPDLANAIFAMRDELLGTLQVRGQERIVLRVGSMATLSRNFQLQVLRRLFGCNDVELVVRSGGFADLLRGLEAHRLDVILANTVPPRIAAEVDDMAVLRLLARERVWLAVVPSIVVRDELESGELVELAQWPDVAEHFHAITLSRRFANLMLRELLGRERWDGDHPGPPLICQADDGAAIRTPSPPRRKSTAQGTIHR